MIGTKLAHYEITAHLGSGGMGDVYQATDSKLSRSVAIKFLPEAFSHDTERVSRFQREARVLASLNHPNIAAIYGLEEINGRHLLELELVPGETLADRITRGAISIEQALPIAKQIAEALEEAHEKGVVHRDLKPANIKVTPDGKVKVLDFGLAKAYESEQANVALSNSPTMMSMAATNAGVILGTAAYMSPEQARGRPVDRRTDIFAFGCVLFEMITGRPAFEGEDVAEILGAVLKTDPDWTRVPTKIPRTVERLLRLCLEKNPKNRRSDAADVRIDIEEALKESTNAMSFSASAGRRARFSWIAAAIMTVALLAIAIGYFRIGSPEAPEMRFEVTTPATSAPLDFALSPDGRNLVFVASGDGPRRLWLRRLDKADAQPLAGTDDATFPFWSPDSRSIGFFANGKLKRMDIGGGAPQILTNAVNGRGGAWNPDNTILFAPTTGAQLFRISASGGGDSVPATQLGPNQSHRFPGFLPDGRHFLFYVQGRPELQGIYLASLDGMEPKRLTASDTAGAFLKPNYVLFIRQGALVIRQLDLGKGELVGNIETLADAGTSDRLASIANGGFSVSADGKIAYRAGGAGRTQFAWFDRTGKSLGTLEKPMSTKL